MTGCSHVDVFNHALHFRCLSIKVTYITPCYLLVLKAIRNPTATLWFWTANFILREFLSQLTSIYVDMRLPNIIENTNRFDSKYGRPTEQRTRPRYYVIAYLGCTFTLLACGCIDILLNKMSAKVIYESILRYIRIIIISHHRFTQ